MITRLRSLVAQCTVVCLAGQKYPTETRNLSFLPRASALHMVMASAAAVASSSREELDNCKRQCILSKRSRHQHAYAS